MTEVTPDVVWRLIRITPNPASTRRKPVHGRHSKISNSGAVDRSSQLSIKWLGMIVIWISFLGRQGEGLQIDLPVPVRFRRERTLVFHLCWDRCQRCRAIP